MSGLTQRDGRAPVSTHIGPHPSTPPAAPHPATFPGARRLITGNGRAAA